jgi:hypothetical protein
VHELDATVSVLLETGSGQTATAYLDRQTGERVIDVREGPDVSLLGRTIDRALRVLDAGSAPHPTATWVFEASDLQTWSPMQLLALRTGAIWDLPYRFGGSTDRTRLVNDAITSRLDWE